MQYSIAVEYQVFPARVPNPRYPTVKLGQWVYRAGEIVTGAVYANGTEEIHHGALHVQVPAGTLQALAPERPPEETSP